MTIEIRLLEAEADRSARERTLDPDAQDLFMRGWALLERRQPVDKAKARELFAQPLSADPNFSLAWVGLANTHLSDLRSSACNPRTSRLPH